MTPAEPSSRLPEKTVPTLTGWGRYPVAAATLVRPERIRDLGPVGEHTLARGMGRSYGDAALLSSGTVVLTERLNRLLEFDAGSGLIRAEAGATLADVLEAAVPRGWFLPVTPGTQFCSLGGCLAADVHGKNHHHDGSFSAHVTEATLILADGSRVRVTPDGENADLFWATAGGMGLTGIVSELTLHLMPIETAWMAVRHTAVADLGRMMEVLDDPGADDRYSVAWIDCLATGSKLGRGVVMTAHHLPRAELSLRVADPLAVPPARKRGVPIDMPGFVLSPPVVRMFNAAYAWRQGRRGSFHTPYGPYFYPLDGIRHWNRLYGKRGFVQYQFALPSATAREGLPLILGRLAASGRSSFLAVLKRFGPGGRGLLSFPIEGYTLALDLPWRDGLPALLGELDDAVLRYGGRVYLAKDSVLSAESFRGMYPRADEFRGIKRSVDPTGRFTSDLARRLGLTP